MKYGIGRKETVKCYDGKMHECTVLDCSVMLSGNTYDNKAEIRKDGFVWWNEQKFWHKHFESEEEIAQVEEKYKALGVNVKIRPNLRITDTDINDISIDY